MHDTLMRYLALRKARLIGMLWVECDHCYLAPLGAVHGYNAREFITPAELHRLVEAAELACLRKSVQPEVLPVELVCAA